MQTDKLFTGQRQIAELGIYHYGARFYSPKLGRFLSADTIVPGYTNPQNLNRFSYVTNNPLRYTDPTGHRLVENEGGGGSGGCGLACLKARRRAEKAKRDEKNKDDEKPPFAHVSGQAGTSTLPSGTLVPQTLPTAPPVATPTPFPARDNEYTTTTVTNDVGETISDPLYVGFGASVGFTSPGALPQIYTGTSPDHMHPAIPYSLEVIAPPRFFVPAQHEILVNTTTTTTTVTYDQYGNVFGQPTVNTTGSSQVFTPYWQTSNQEFNFHSSWQ